jgi:tetratricopeptide (TPR) repeat protein
VRFARVALLFLAIVPIALSAMPEQALERGAVSLDRGDFQSAARQARAYLATHPGSLTGRLLLARAYLGLNDSGAALKELRAALRRDPNCVDALYYVVKVTAILSQQEFSQAAAMAPDSARTHQLKAEALEAGGDDAGAEREYLAALGKIPGTAYILNSLGDLKRHQREYDTALTWYMQVLDKDPENYDALYGAGACRRLSHVAEEAIPFFRRALKVDPTSMAAKMALGESLLFSGQAAEAVPLLEEAAKAGPRIRRVQALLGRAYQAVGRKADAERMFEYYRKMPNPFVGDEAEPGDQ